MPKTSQFSSGRLTPVDSFPLGSNKTVVRDATAMERTVLAVLEARFPELLKNLTATLSPELPETFGARGEYTPSNETIRIGNMYGSQGNSANYTKNNKTGQVTESNVNFTTADVMDAVNVFLHEISHASRKTNAKEYFKDLTSEEKKQVATKANPTPFTNLYSISPDSLNEEELVANAASLLTMKNKNMIVEGSYSDSQLRTLQNIMSSMPKVSEAINKSLAESTKSTPSLLDKILEFMK